MIAKTEIRVRKKMFRDWEKAIQDDPYYELVGDITAETEQERCEHCGDNSAMYSLASRHKPSGIVRRYEVCFLCYEVMEVPEGEGE